jgi:NAD(P)-dependent dehydrogenase (short-subunit alcohol dehydrogenase family)
MNAAFLSLQSKVAVIVGGTAGIGRAISLGFADAGAAVIASGRNKDKVDGVAAELEGKNCSTLRVMCDITSRASLEDLLQHVLQRFGKVDILVNCAAKIRRADTDISGRRVERYSGYQPDRHPAIVPDFWQVHAGAKIRSHYKYCLAQ